MAFNIHETIMALIGGRTVPMTFIIIGVFVLGGVVLDEESTFKIISNAEKPLERAYAIGLIVKDALVVVVLLGAMAMGFRVLNLKATHKLNGQPKGNGNGNDLAKTD